MGEPVAIGVDIGGSGVRVATLRNGVLDDLATVPLRERSVRHVVECVTRLVHGRSVGPLGVAVPGFVERGAVVASPNFPTWSHVPLTELLRVSTGRDVVIGNDATYAALGCPGAPHRVVLTLGTGVGGGVVVDGRPLSGRFAAELGHIDVGSPNACGCGAIGCLEASCSVTALMAGAKRLGLPPDVDALTIHPDATPLWREARRALSSGLTTILNVFGPDEVVLVGGLTRAERLLRVTPTPIGPHRSVPIRWEGRADPFAIRGAATAASSA